MATYMEIEASRISGDPRYVYYEYDKLDPRCEDEYSTDAVWSKYFVTTPNSSREQIYQDALVRHDQHTDPAQSFRRVEQLLRSKGCNDATINEFRRLLTINARGDQTCELMLIAGATVDFNAVATDIANCKTGDTKAISTILHNLAGQVHCAAFNGAFTKIFKNAYRLSGAKQPVPQFESRIENLYNALLFGSNKTKPIDIPSAYQKFELIDEMNAIASQYERLNSADVPAMINAHYKGATKTLKGKIL